MRWEGKEKEGYLDVWTWLLTLKKWMDYGGEVGGGDSDLLVGTNSERENCLLSMENLV